MIQTQKIEKSDKEEIIEEIISEMKGMFSVVGESIEQLAQATSNGFVEVHARIDNVENRLGKLELKVDTMDVKIDDLGKDLNGKIDKIDAKMTKNFVQVHQEIFRMKITNDLE